MNSSNSSNFLNSFQFVGSRRKKENENEKEKKKEKEAGKYESIRDKFYLFEVREGSFKRRRKR